MWGLTGLRQVIRSSQSKRTEVDYFGQRQQIRPIDLNRATFSLISHPIILAAGSANKVMERKFLAVA